MNGLRRSVLPQAQPQPAQGTPDVTSSLFLLDVQQHDDKDDEHHDRAGVDDHLDSGDERRREHHVETSERNEDADQRDRAVERITLRNDSNRAADRESGEEYEEESKHQRERRLDNVKEYQTVAVKKILSSANGQQKLPTKIHQLIKAEARQRAAQPDVKKQKEDHLHQKTDHADQSK